MMPTRLWSVAIPGLFLMGVLFGIGSVAAQETVPQPQAPAQESAPQTAPTILEQPPSVSEQGVIGRGVSVVIGPTNSPNFSGMVDTIRRILRAIWEWEQFWDLLFTSGAHVYLSPDGRNLGGGGQSIDVAPSPSRVEALVPCPGRGVFAAFYVYNIYGTTSVTEKTQNILGQPKTNHYKHVGTLKSSNIYLSPNGYNFFGGGTTQVVYNGKGRVDALTCFGGGV